MVQDFRIEKTRIGFMDNQDHIGVKLPGKFNRLWSSNPKNSQQRRLPVFSSFSGLLLWVSKTTPIKPHRFPLSNLGTIVADSKSHK
jgi:hypothetical protein